VGPWVGVLGSGSCIQHHGTVVVLVLVVVCLCLQRSGLAWLVTRDVVELRELRFHDGREVTAVCSLNLLLVVQQVDNTGHTLLLHVAHPFLHWGARVGRSTSEWCGNRAVFVVKVQAMWDMYVQCTQRQECRACGLPSS
jgi:hypothetical protein